MTVLGPPAVSNDSLWWLNASGHQERRPVHSVEAQNVLAHKVHIGGPETGKGVRVVGEASSSDVVGESVEPHVNHMVIVVGHWNAPCCSLLRAADREIVEPTAYLSNDFTAAILGLNAVWIALQPLQQWLCGVKHVRKKSTEV